MENCTFCTQPNTNSRSPRSSSRRHGAPMGKRQTNTKPSCNSLAKKLGETKHEQIIFQKKTYTQYTQTFEDCHDVFFLARKDFGNPRKKPSQRMNNKISPHLPNARQSCFEKLLPWSPGARFLKSMCSPLARNIMKYTVHQTSSAKIHKDTLLETNSLLLNIGHPTQKN